MVCIVGRDVHVRYRYRYRYRYRNDDWHRVSYAWHRVLYVDWILLSYSVYGIYRLHDGIVYLIYSIPYV